VLAGPVMNASLATAEQLLAPDTYIDAVLSEQNPPQSDRSHE